MGTVSSLRKQGVVQVTVLRGIVLLIHFLQKTRNQGNFVGTVKNKIKIIACRPAEILKLVFCRGKTIKEIINLIHLNFQLSTTEPTVISAILLGGNIESNMSWIPSHLDIYLNAHKKIIY